MFREYEEGHISKHIDSNVRYIALCYTTGESKTSLWCKFCLTFTGSVTEWHCSFKSSRDEAYF